MKRREKEAVPSQAKSIGAGYDTILTDVVGLLEMARRASARTVNAIMTGTYWEIGRRIVEYEQGGLNKAQYGQQLMDQLSQDLTSRFGRGFGRRNLFQMRAFYLAYPEIVQTPPAQLGEEIQSEIVQTASVGSSKAALRKRFPLPWSHYVKLLAVKDPDARAFYESEALSSGWTVRQPDRQISSKFYERTLLSKE